MRFHKYRREETKGAINFGEYQIYVCTLSDSKGNAYKGLTALASDKIMELPFVLTEKQAEEFIHFLESVLAGGLPRSFRIKGKWFMHLNLKFSKHESNTVKGRISLSGAIWLVTVKYSSLESCISCLRMLWGSTRNK